MATNEPPRSAVVLVNGRYFDHYPESLLEQARSDARELRAQGRPVKLVWRSALWVFELVTKPRYRLAVADTVHRAAKYLDIEHAHTWGRANHGLSRLRAEAKQEQSEACAAVYGNTKEQG